MVSSSSRLEPLSAPLIEILVLLRRSLGLMEECGERDGRRKLIVKIAHNMIYDKSMLEISR